MKNFVNLFIWLKGFLSPFLLTIILVVIVANLFPEIQKLVLILLVGIGFMISIIFANSYLRVMHHSDD